MLLWLKSDRIADLAERVAGRSRMAVWQRVTGRLASLDPAEARGYARARASGTIHSETERLIEQEGAKVARFRGQIEAAALKLLTRALVLECAQRQPEIGIRRAA